MAITSISHSVCLNCTDVTFTITGSITGTPAAPTNSLYVTDPSGNTTTYDSTTTPALTNQLYTSPFTFEISAGTTSTVGAASVSSVTLGWTTAANTTYSFILRSMSAGYVQDYAISYTTGATTTATEIGNNIRDLVNDLPAGLNLATVTYTSGSLLTIQGNNNVFFGVDALNNLTTSSVTSNPSTTATFDDGIWIVKWVLTDGSTFTSTTNSMFLCNVEKCVREKASKVDVGCGCCGTRESEEAMDAILYLEGIKSAAACGKLEKAKTILSGLEDICNNDCKHC
jgi:hypothetical protein